MSGSLQKNEAKEAGQRIATHRASLAMSLQDAAKVIGCSHQSVANWEEGDEPREVYLPGIRKFLATRASAPGPSAAKRTRRGKR